MSVAADVESLLVSHLLHVGWLFKNGSHLRRLSLIRILKLPSPHVGRTLLVALVLGKGRRLMHIHRSV